MFKVVCTIKYTHIYIILDYFIIINNIVDFNNGDWASEASTTDDKGDLNDK